MSVGISGFQWAFVDDSGFQWAFVGRQWTQWASIFSIITFHLYFRTQSPKEKSIKNQCYCGKSFRKTVDLSKHQRNHCQMLKDFRLTGLIKCNKCPKTFKSLIDLKQHQKEDSLSSPQCPNAITCGSCGNGFNTKDYQEHFFEGHCYNLEKPYRCLGCGISFKTAFSYFCHSEICTQKLKATEYGNDHLMFKRSCDKCGLQLNSIRGWRSHIRKCGRKPTEKHGFGWHHHQNCCCSNCASRLRRTNLKKHSKQFIQDSEWKANVRVNGENVEVDLGSKFPPFDDASQPIRKKITSKQRLNAKKRNRNRLKPKLNSLLMDPFEILCDIYEWLEFFLVDSEWFEWLIFHFPYFSLNTIYTGISLLRWLDSHRIHLLVNSEWIDLLIFHIPQLLFNIFCIGLYVIRSLISYSSSMDPFGILCDIYEWLVFFLVDSEWFEWLIFHFPYFSLNTIYIGISLLRWLDSYRIGLLVNSEWIDLLIFHIPQFLFNIFCIGLNVTRCLISSSKNQSGICYIKEFLFIFLL